MADDLSPPVSPPMEEETPSLDSPVSEASPAGMAGDADDNPDEPISEEKIEVEEKLMAVKDKFYELLGANTKVKKVKIFTEEEYTDVMTVLREWRSGEYHSPLHNRWHQNYNIVENTSRSAALRREGKKVATKEQMFAIIMGAHQHLAHGRDKRATHNFITDTWYGITQEDVASALNLCPICFASQTKISAKQGPLRMILSETVGKRAQMDLIDMTSQPDPDGYCWILVLYDHHSGFGAAKALKSKTSKEVSIAVIQILCLFPDFDILQSDNGGEFLGETVKSVNK
mmetsp:Transcript_1031/g.1613  ORF Transcript_1031/g.1613 Transcript_1031/m.1613 type:complete len:286 (+) Transcript_1031:42-899(+)